MAEQRSSNSRLLAIGFAVLVLGVALVYLVLRSTDDDPAQPSPAATDVATDPAQDQVPLTPEQISTARLPLPLEIPDGSEALAVRVNFMRSVAAIPAPGDFVNIYRLPEPDAAAAPQDGATEPSSPVGDSILPPPGPASEKVLDNVEVLAVTGPLPAANDGTLTMVLSVDPATVPSLMTLANDSELWFTLLPAVEDGGTEESTEEPA